MESQPPKSSKDDDNIDIFFDGMQIFRSKWNVLNERCKQLEASLHEAKIEKAQLQAKLELSREHVRKIEKEKEELAIVVHELHRDLKNSSLHKWIDTLGEKLSSLNEVPKLSSQRITNEAPRVIDDVILIDSDDEDDLCSNSFSNGPVTDKNSQVAPDAVPSTPNSDSTDHDYTSPSNQERHQSEENVSQGCNNQPSSSSNEISCANNESTSEICSTLMNNESSITPEHPTQQNEVFFNVENSDPNGEETPDVCQIPIIDTIERSSDCSNLYDISVANNETSLVNQTTLSTGAMVSVVDTMMSVGNSLQRNISSAEQTSILDETEATRNDEIPCRDTVITSQNSPSIVPVVDDEPGAIIEEEMTCDNRIPESDSPISQECTNDVQISNSVTSLSTDKEKDYDTNHDFLVDVPVPTSLEPSPKHISSTNDDIFPRNEETNPSTKEIPTAVSPENLPQPNVEESESTINDDQNTDRGQDFQNNVNMSNSPQLIPVIDDETYTNEKQNNNSLCDSVSSPLTLIEYPLQRSPTIDNETSVENDSEIINLAENVIVDQTVSAESPQGHFLAPCSETSDGNCIDFQISSMDTIPACQRHLQFTSESLLQQGVNHEEILPAENVPSESVPDTESSEEPEDTNVFSGVPDDEDDSTNGEKSTNAGTTPEELMSQIFGSPLSSPDRNSDIVCITNEPSMIDLNLSDEDEESLLNNSKPGGSIVQPELIVNLPRIFAPKFEVFQQPVNNIKSDLERDTETTENEETELSNSKRSCPSSSELEPKPKRSSPSKSSEMSQDYVRNSDYKSVLKCLVCKGDEIYESFSSLDTHIITSHPNPCQFYFRCRYGEGSCKRHFRTTKKMNDHIRRRHSGEDLSLSAEKLYPGEKPWKCSVCEKIYAHSSHLRIHLLRIHGVSEAKRIGNCEQKMHVRKIKNKKSIKKSLTNGYSVGECVICLNDEGSSEKFKAYVELDDHIFKNHPNPYPFYLRCPFCKNENVRHFKGLSWLNNHIANNHKSKVISET